MPNNKYLPEPLMLKGPLSLLEAALKEVAEVLSLKADTTDKAPYNGLVLDEINNYWFTNKGEKPGNWNRKILTLPQDWNTLMDILEELKKPQIPEYVKYHTRQVAKVKAPNTIDHKDYRGKEEWYMVYRPNGEEIMWSAQSCTPITEEEFIQGGLKELEEAGFVVGAIIEQDYRPIFKVGYSKAASAHQSYAVDFEVQKRGFSFHTYHGKEDSHSSYPVGQCTLLPKAQTLPQTSQDILYKVEGSNVYLGDEPQTVRATHIGTLKHWLKLGVQSITLPCGTLTSEDLKTIVGL